MASIFSISHSTCWCSSVSFKPNLNLNYLCIPSCFERNLSHPINIHTSHCRSPKTATVVGQAALGISTSQRESPLLETQQQTQLNLDEDDDDSKEGVDCLKEDVPNKELQRDVAFLMGDTPSPTPSVISIQSEATDGEEVEEDKPQLCCLRG